MNDEIIYEPRSGEEMEKATLNAPIYLYSELCRQTRKHGIRRVIANMFHPRGYPFRRHCLILLQDPSDMKSGHWMSLSINPDKHEMYYFSTYGGKPDVEKNKWITEDDQLDSGQELDIFNDGLKEYQKRGWTIHYNDHPYQFPGDKTATCGIYTAAFIRSGMNPDEFYDFNIRNGITPYDYYRAYFL